MPKILILSYKLILSTNLTFFYIKMVYLYSILDKLLYYLRTTRYKHNIWMLVCAMLILYVICSLKTKLIRIWFSLMNVYLS